MRFMPKKYSARVYAQGHIVGALSIDYYSPRFKTALDRLDRGKAYLVYCRSGNRSAEDFQRTGFHPHLPYEGRDH